MPHPRDVFERPDEHWAFLQAPNDTIFEGQHFDRKEAGTPNATAAGVKHQVDETQKEVISCISAFANRNRDGGLLVLGVSRDGKIRGIGHLSEEQRNCLTNIGPLLRNQSAAVKFVDCHDDIGNPNRICLIYVPYEEHAICETPSDSPKAWLRHGSQDVLMNQSQRDQVRREKRILNWETEYCCPFDPDDVDHDVLTEFRRSYLVDSTYEYSDEEMLYQAGALTKTSAGLAFTNAGFLFFSKNPQRVLAASYIRLMRFEVPNEMFAEKGLPTFDKSFMGSITKQIRDVRSFFQNSGFFKLYQKRNPEGGFIEEPEYPYVAIDEAIVNAVAHRDYAMTVPIKCETYRDAFVVANSGRLLQEDHDLPPRFSLANTTLVSTPRNPMLIRWLRGMPDGQGAAFVRELGEGTKRMRDEMTKAGLPAPVYKTAQAHTTVILYNNVTEREAALRLGTVEQPTEFANLYPLEVTSDQDPLEASRLLAERGNVLMSALKDALVANGWYVDRFKFSRMIAHRRGASVAVPDEVARVVRLYPAYSLQLREYWQRFYLCIDYHLEVKNVRSIRELLIDVMPSDLIGRSATAQWQGWRLGKIVALDRDHARIYLFDYQEEQIISSNRVIPDLPPALMTKLLTRKRISFDLPRKIKEASLALETNAARIRAERTQLVAEELAEAVFPLILNDTRVHLHTVPAPLLRRRAAEGGLQVASVPEPLAEFYHHQETSDIREGITKYGAYSDSLRSIELVPICAPIWSAKMTALIERLKAGKYKYRGSERTFRTRFTYSTIVTVPSPEMALGECRRLLNEHPEWIGDKRLDRIFLVHTPEGDYATDDEQSPYYLVKRYLLESGIPCQMIDSPTLDNPEWKDLNLALNIAAKCGITPWVLPDAIPDADFFVGLSYTQNGPRGEERFMGFANVFNRYGKWEFYSGNTEVFPYQERADHFRRLISETLGRLSLSETPNIYFHYSAKFSRQEREAILGAARDVRPLGTFAFVSINTHHNVRLYDSRNQTDGSLSRGSYVLGSPNQIYLSTTGYNPLRKSVGTPEMLEINARIEHPSGMPDSPPDMRAIAVQMLSLTKLNWASTESLCGVPITTKYASDIAYLTAAFMRQGPGFRLHPVLERTPWFL